MKKKLLTCICLCLFTAVSECAFAAAGDSSQSGTTVTVGETAATELTYNASPSVSMNVVASKTAYSIMAANSLTDKTNGLEYGTLSTATGYAQGQKTTDAGSGPSTNGQTASAISGDVTWTWMGGS